MSDVLDHFKCVIKKRDPLLTDSPPIRTYTKKIKSRSTFKAKTVYNPQLLTPETMKLLRSTKNKITQDKMVNAMVILCFSLKDY